jgi:hypothetical protein
MPLAHGQIGAVYWCLHDVVVELPELNRAPSPASRSPDLQEVLRSGMAIPEPSNPFPYNRVVPPGSEALGVQLLQLVFPRIGEAQAKLDGVYVQVIEDRSSLRLDDRYLGWWRGGSLHTTAMLAAVDALRTTQTILEPVIAGNGALPMSALYPILRAAIESAALAIYLLEPTSRDERLRRSYLVAAEDAKYNGSFAASMGNAESTTRADTRDQIRTLLDSRPSIEQAGSFAFVDVKYSMLVENADAAMAADPALPPATRMKLIAWWQLLSGLSHGKQWAFVASMERSEAVVDEANETAHVRMSSSIAAVALVLQVAVEALETALRLFGQRSHTWSGQPEDADEPDAVSYTELQGRPIPPPQSIPVPRRSRRRS